MLLLSQDGNRWGSSHLPEPGLMWSEQREAVYALYWVLRLVLPCERLDINCCKSKISDSTAISWHYSGSLEVTQLKLQGQANCSAFKGRVTHILWWQCSLAPPCRPERHCTISHCVHENTWWFRELIKDTLIKKKKLKSQIQSVPRAHTYSLNEGVAQYQSRQWKVKRDWSCHGRCCSTASSTRSVPLYSWTPSAPTLLSGARTAASACSNLVQVPAIAAQDSLIHLLPICSSCCYAAVSASLQIQSPADISLHLSHQWTSSEETGLYLRFYYFVSVPRGTGHLPLAEQSGRESRSE